jgi:hypothetical protein
MKNDRWSMYGLEKNLDPYWLKQNYRLLMRDQIIILIICIAMVDIIAIIFIFAFERFKYSNQFLIFSTIPIIISIFVFYYGLIFIKKWSKINLGELVLYGFTTKKAYEKTLENLKKLYNKMNIEFEVCKDRWEGSSELFKTKKGETLIKIRYLETTEDNLFISIFNSKQYPTHKEALRLFFKEFLFRDKEDKVYLKLPDQVKWKVIEKAEDMSLKNEYSYLRYSEKVPWNEFSYFILGFIYYAVVESLLLISPKEDFDFFLTAQIGLNLFLVMILAMTIYIYKKWQKDKKRLNELKYLLGITE